MHFSQTKKVFCSLMLTSSLVSLSHNGFASGYGMTGHSSSHGICGKFDSLSRESSSTLGDRFGETLFPSTSDTNNSYNQTGRVATSLMSSGILGITRLFLGQGQGIFSTIMNEAAKKIGTGLSETLIHGVIMPSVVRKQRQTFTPHLYDDSTMTLTSYPEKVEGIILDDEAALQVETFVSNLNRAARANKSLPSLLLYGPPGTGKTEIAKRIAAEGNYVIKVYSASKIMSQHHQNFAHLLQYIEGLGAAATKKSKPSTSMFSKVKKKTLGLLGLSNKKVAPQPNPVKHIIFIDEGEALFGGTSMMGQRNEYLKEFLTVAGSGSPNISFIVTTNFPDTIDQAAYRRFDYSVEIGLPNLENRIKILEKYISQDIKGEDRSEAKIEYGLLADLAEDPDFEAVSEGLSGSDIRRVSPIIVTAALKRNQGLITKSEVISSIRFDKLNRQKTKLEKAKRDAEAKRKRQEEIALRQAEFELEEKEQKRRQQLQKIFGTDDNNED